MTRIKGHRTAAHAALCSAVALAALPAAIDAFDLQGHRGTRGLMPENTLAAYSKAMEIGVTTIETDLAVTRDGVIVISHDPFLNPDVVRAPDGHWLTAKGPAIHDLTLAELERYDIGRLDPASKYAKQFPEQQPVDGQHFPTLAQVFALVKGNAKPVRLNIETKITPTNPGETVDVATFARLVVAAVRSAGMTERTSIESFDWRTLIEAKKLAPDIETVCLTIESSNFDNVQASAASPSPWLAGIDLSKLSGSLPRAVKAAGCTTWSPFWRNVSSARISESHALGLKVLPWTVNDEADMANLIESGVDGLITDYPDRARHVMAAKGVPLP